MGRSRSRGSNLVKSLLGIKSKRRRRRRRRRRRVSKAQEEMQNMLDMDTLREIGSKALDNTMDTMGLNTFAVDQSHQVRKCKMLSTTEMCVTVDPHRGEMSLEVAVGTAKSKKEGDTATAWDDLNELEYDDFYMEDDYDYAEYGYDDDDSMYDEAFDVEDEWFDEQQQTQWLITDVAADETFDSLWADNANWEEVDQVDSTFSGRSVERKCLHMWGQRLCLCQFLGWMDSRKFQCQAKGAMFNPVGPPMMSQQQVEDME